MNSKFMELNGPLMAPQWGAWGARHGTDKNPDYRPKMGYWMKMFLGDERAQGSRSLAFADNKQISQGKSIMKYFRIKYKLEYVTPRPWKEHLSLEEQRIKKNRNRSTRRQRQRERELRAAESEGFKRGVAAVLKSKKESGEPGWK